MIKSIRKTIVLFAPLVFLLSCGSEQSSVSDEAAVETTSEMTAEDLARADEMIQNMPSPIEMAILVKHAGGEYNSKLLNDIKNLDTYVTKGKKTINFGWRRRDSF